MEKWMLVVGTNCTDVAQEKEFEEWYDKTHFPDVLEVANFTRATRYKNTEAAEGEAKYLALYEIETDDLESFIKVHNANMDKKRAEGRIFAHTRVSRGYYKEIYSLSK